MLCKFPLLCHCGLKKIAGGERVERKRECVCERETETIGVGECACDRERHWEADGETLHAEQNRLPGNKC